MSVTWPACCPVCPVHVRPQSKRALIENLAHNRGELRLRMDNIRKTDPKLAVQGLPAPEKWSVQLFRSIDSGDCSAVATIGSLHVLHDSLDSSSKAQARSYAFASAGSCFGLTGWGRCVLFCCRLCCWSANKC